MSVFRTTIRERQGLQALLLLLLGGCSGMGQTPAVEISRFAATPSEGVAGSPVVFSWQALGAADCTLTLGEGAPAEPESCAEGSISHTYAAPGTYRARLEATSANGSSAARELTLTVRAADEAEEGSPVAAFTTEADGLSVLLDASASRAPADTRFLWDFGDGNGGEGQRVSHSYEGPGEYRVTLSLSGSGGESSVSESVSVSAERLTLFDGELSAWQRTRGGEANWRLGEEGGTPYFEVTPGSSVTAGDIETKERFGDFRLHLEFWVPQTPPNSAEQNRGNSGVYLQGRYEVQILDSFGRPLGGANDAGAIYEVKDADHNASRPAETWQSYDIVFRAARFSAGQKTEPARVSVTWNGQLVQDNVEIPGPTRLGAAESGDHGALSGPLRLQDHGHRVRYRNIWLEPL